MVKQSKVVKLDRVFHALADSTRRDILARVAAEQHLSISEVAAPFKMSLVAVSKHVRVLEEANLVKRRRRGRVHELSFNPTALRGADQLLAFYRQFWNDRFDQLDKLLKQRKRKK